MSSINQVISELAHSVKQADSVPVRTALKLAIIHTRNQLIRHSYEQHGYSDKALYQRVRLSLKDVPDGDISEFANVGAIGTIKRTVNKVPRPVRLVNNLPFQSVRTIGVKNPLEIPFVKEAASRFYNYLPGMCPNITYDYINEYIYINITNNANLNKLQFIIVESPFEMPHLIETETVEGKVDITKINDDDEFLIPEDMIENLKQIILANFNGGVIRNTNEAYVPSIVN